MSGEYAAAILNKLLVEKVTSYQLRDRHESC